MASKDKKLMRKVENLLKADEKKQTRQEEAFAFDDGGRRFRAARQGDDKGGKGKGKGKKGKPDGKGGKSRGGDGDCPRCHGHHPECRECHNSAASNESAWT